MKDGERLPDPKSQFRGLFYLDSCLSFGGKEIKGEKAPAFTRPTWGGRFQTVAVVGGHYNAAGHLAVYDSEGGITMIANFDLIPQHVTPVVYKAGINDRYPSYDGGDPLLLGLLVSGGGDGTANPGISGTGVRFVNFNSKVPGVFDIISTEDDRWTNAWKLGADPLTEMSVGVGDRLRELGFAVDLHKSKHAAHIMHLSPRDCSGRQ